jgi:hypothetical protein
MHCGDASLVTTCHFLQQTATSFDSFSQYLFRFDKTNMNITTEKTLRLMLKRGIPMDAVKQRADMAGIDMRVVLQQQQQQQHQEQGQQVVLLQHQEDEEQTNTPKESPCSLSPALISKYKRMLKIGVSLPAVQQLAFVEGGYDPEHIARIFESVLAVDARKRRHGHHGRAEGATSGQQDESCTDYRPMAYSTMASRKRAHSKAKLVKYRRMMKVGVPISAVEQCILLDQSRGCHSTSHGHVSDEDKENEENLKIILKKIRQLQEDNMTNNSNNYFSVTEKGVRIYSSSKSYYLAALVRKMVQTVQSGTSKVVSIKQEGEEMDIEHEILYHALGALQGVQVALDDFNSTIDCDNGTYSDAEIKIKRHAFVEIAKSLSIRLLPSTLKDHVSIPGLDELIAHICSRYKEKIAHTKQQLEEGSYDFDSLAYLYQPGSKVVAKNIGGGSGDGGTSGGAVDMMCLVAWNRYEMGMSSSGKAVKAFKACFKYIVALSPSEATIVEVVEEMPFFQGCRQVMDPHLTFVPLGAYTVAQQNRLMKNFTNRGKTYNEVALCGSFAHMDYQKGSFFFKQHSMGLGLLGGNSTGKVNSFAAGLASDGRIIIDAQGAYEHGHTLSFGYDPMVMGIKYKFKEYQLYAHSMAQPNTSKTDTSAAINETILVFDKVPERYLPIVWPYVVGFSLTMKAWGDVLVDGMTRIQWKKDMFDCLVLPESYKRMIKALVKNKPTSFQDLVEGKGQGTVFLMYGSPGVGKTLTAEAIAEVLQKPLYSISMGSMGTTARELEGNLTFIMNMSAKWDALILLDEADSFLETRSSNSSLERNAMVCVMLKLVEYFSGILFLTSNRIDSIDPAFLTRITLALHYDSLDENARKRIWENLLIKSGYENSVQNGTIDMGRLAKVPLNGREIKNALRLAISIAAEDDGTTLSQKTLTEMVNIVHDCKQRIEKSFSSDHSTKAKKERRCRGFKLW